MQLSHLVLVIHSVVLLVGATTDIGSLSSSPQFFSQVKCPDCSQIRCRNKRLDKMKCYGGVVKGMCGCCLQCAKLVGESCGGPKDVWGKCAENLTCVAPGLSQGKSANPGKAPAPGLAPMGTCQKASTPEGSEAKPKVKSCAPPCTFDYCSRKPRAVCSAVNNAETPSPCHGRCQHTSCMACQHKVKSDCPRCQKDDRDCLRRFGRCLRKDICSKQKFPCKSKNFGQRWATLYSEEQERVEFVCHLPGCL